MSRVARLILLGLLSGCRTSAPLVIDVPPRAPELVIVEPERPLPVPPAVTREFRAAWVTPLWGGEWPSRSTLTTAQQQAELITLLDRARAAGLNAIVLHVRIAADALYPTERAPWSEHLTGRAGRAPEPFYDPLAFAVEQAHARGLELHAWFNPFRAAPPDRRVAQPASHITRRAPERVLTYGAQRWIDPGFPQSRQEVLADILDVVTRYDIDGIHLDDYFYPYVETRTVRGRRQNIPFPDSMSWRLHGSGNSRADWRRANIDTFVATLYREVKASKPWLPVGISPFGIWRSGTPAGITGLDAYSEIYADALLWLRSGWLDYAAPQLYWPIAGAQSRFTRLDAWWREQNILGRHVWPGLHTELEATGSAGWNAGEIRAQVALLRAANARGHIHFRMKSLRNGAVDSLYPDAAIAPEYSWLGDAIPASPLLSLDAAGLRIAPADDSPVRWWLVQTLDHQDVWHTRRIFADTRTLSLPHDCAAIAVRAISPTGISSAASRLLIPHPLQSYP